MQWACFDTRIASSRALVREADLAAHGEALDERSQTREDLVAVEVEAVEVELDALEEDGLARVGVLVGVHDVAVVPVHPVGHRRHEALLIGARQEQRGGGHPHQCCLYPDGP